MESIAHNPFLALVMRTIRHSRPQIPIDFKYYNRVERSRGGNYVEVWFMTSGCRWDAQGGCTMCNYGRGHSITADEMVHAVAEALAAIQIDVTELVVSPSGSMLDPAEVPVSARQRIYSLVRDFPTPQFLFETRPETVTEEALNELVGSIPGKRLVVEMGYESSDARIQRFCINKGITPAIFSEKAQLLHRHSVGVCANISLGTAFLSPREAIADAVASVRFTLEHGADTAVLFPLHVKPYTLLAWLASKGLYRPPSLWSLVETLAELGDNLMDRVEISWYRSYYNDSSKIIASPTTCPNCYERILELLDRYRDSRSSSVIHEIRAIDCSCKEKWQREIGEAETRPLPERIYVAYELLARDLGLYESWSSQKVAIAESLFERVEQATELEESC